MALVSERAWNNFVLQREPCALHVDTDKRAAAIAALFLGFANNGGLNSFLTASYDYDSVEVQSALFSIGAFKSAKQLADVLRELGNPLLRCSQDVRWDQLDRLWTEDLDQYEMLSEEANEELMEALERHVGANEAYYIALSDREN